MGSFLPGSLATSAQAHPLRQSATNNPVFFIIPPTAWRGPSIPPTLSYDLEIFDRRGSQFCHSKHLSLKNRIRALWLWWTVSALLLVLLWVLSLQQRALALKNARQVALQANLRELSSGFSALDSLPLVLLRTLQQQPQRLQELQKRARPFATLELNQPAWAATMARDRADQAEDGLLLLRPLPPGYEQKPLPPSLPDLYLAYCLKQPGQNWLIMNLDLEYLFEHWLSRHFERFGLSGLRWRLVEGPSTLPTLLSEQNPPFPRSLQVTLDDGPLLQENLNLHLAGLAVALLVLVGFAGSLRVAAVGIQKELEFTEARSRFMAMASHELRTPIATIKMYSDILQNDLQADKLDQYHQVIARQAGRLQHLVENLLEAGALERGQRTFQRQPVDLNEIVEEAVRHAEGEGVQLDLAPNLAPVQADRAALLQVLANLIDNARQYAKDLSISTRPHQVIVSDRGPGIADKQRVFQAYQRASQKKGFGLGLSVVHNFMLGQGGRVELDDNPGGGARFTLHFPA